MAAPCTKSDIKCSISKIVLEPLSHPGFLESVKVFSRLFLSCLGHRGGLKILVSPTRNLLVTSASQRLLKSLPLSHPVLLFVSKVVENQNQSCGDFGLFTGAFTLQVLKTLLYLDISRDTIINITEYISDILTDFLCSTVECTVSVNFDSVHDILQVLLSILRSKPGIGFNRDEARHVSVLVARSFIQTVPQNSEKGGKFGQVIIRTHEGACPMNSECIPGILYPSPDIPVECEWSWNFNYTEHRKIPVILFNISLTNNLDDKSVSFDVYHNAASSGFVESILSMCDCIVELGVGVVACQKLVDSRVIKYLRKRGVLALERLGRDLCVALQDISGAIPLSAVSDSLDSSVLGYLDDVKHVEKFDKSYLLLSREDGNAASLLLTNLTEESCEELKVVTHQCIDTLRSLLRNPLVCLGGGCLETWLCGKLLKKVMDSCPELCSELQCSRQSFQAVVACIARSLLQIAAAAGGHQSPLFMDNTYSHLWASTVDHKPPTSSYFDFTTETCMCGLIHKSELHTGADWIELVDVKNHLSNAIEFSKALVFKNDSLTLNYGNTVILDNYIFKKSAYVLSLEAVTQILQIQSCIFQKQNL